MADPTPFSRFLLSRMEALNMTPDGLAARLGGEVTPHAVRGWMRAEYQPHRERLPALAFALDVKPSELAIAAAGMGA